MDNIPIEYSERMMAEQMVTMEAFQFITQLLICFALLITFVILIVNISGLGPREVRAIFSLRVWFIENQPNYYSDDVTERTVLN